MSYKANSIKKIDQNFKILINTYHEIELIIGFAMNIWNYSEIKN